MVNDRQVEVGGAIQTVHSTHKTTKKKREKKRRPTVRGERTAEELRGALN